MPGSKSAISRPRRTPDESRAHILNAAIRLFAERGPDAAGLKEVAKAAGVSHGLVTHYFGTYDALVDEAIASHVRRGRAAFFEALVRAKADDVGAWLEPLFALTNDPVYARLAAWGHCRDASTTRPCSPVANRECARSSTCAFIGTARATPS
jgi:AcrR family transcriptional regulator